MHLLTEDASLTCSPETQTKIDAKVVEIVREAHTKALQILKENEIKVDKSIVPALVNLAKDKEVVIQLCKEILPRVNNTFCAYKEVEREYYDKNEQDKNKKLKMSEIEDIAILGSSHKRFGYNEPIEYDFGIYYETFNGTDKRIVKCAVPIKRYTFSLIAKCVTYYLTHPKNDR